MVAGTSMEFGISNYLIVSVLLWLTYDTVRSIATVTHLFEFINWLIKYFSFSFGKNEHLFYPLRKQNV